ncbi:hypothetical protein [Lacunimicrobium album]
MSRILAIIFLFVCSANISCAEEPRELDAILSPDDGKIVITKEQDRVLVTLHSERGIGKAVLKRLGEKWPSQITLRIHLSGLESFKITTPSTRLSWSVSSHGQQESMVTLLEDSKETALKPDHELYSPITIIPKKATIPLSQESYFEIVLPAPLLKPDESELQLQWIDFYRN